MGNIVWNFFKGMSIAVYGEFGTLYLINGIPRSRVLKVTFSFKNSPEFWFALVHLGNVWRIVFREFVILLDPFPLMVTILSANMSYNIRSAKLTHPPTPPKKNKKIKK